MTTFVIVNQSIKEGKVESMLELLANILPGLVSFAGCRAVRILQDDSDPTRLTLVQRWDRKSDFEAYVAWREETGVAATIRDLLATPTSIRYLTEPEQFRG